MTITIDQIKTLRDTTSISLSLCKKALEESNGDQEKAIEWLRKEGGLKAANKADRATNEGVIAIEIQGSKASIIKLACETDFVAKNSDFKDLAQSIAKELLDGKSTNEMQNKINEAIVKMGENLQLLGAEFIEGENIGSYIHSTGKLAAVVAISNGSVDLAKDLCMQVVASSPSVISPDEITSEAVAKEKEIWTEHLKNEGKPEAIWDKIMTGKERKFREENALLTQNFVKDPEKIVKDIVGDAKVTKMLRISL